MMASRMTMMKKKKEMSNRMRQTWKVIWAHVCVHDFSYNRKKSLSTYLIGVAVRRLDLISDASTCPDALVQVEHEALKEKISVLPLIFSRPAEIGREPLQGGPTELSTENWSSVYAVW